MRAAGEGLGWSVGADGRCEQVGVHLKCKVRAPQLVWRDSDPPSHHSQMNFLLMCQPCCLTRCQALGWSFWLPGIFPFQQDSAASLLCPALPPAVLLLIQLPAFLLSDVISAPHSAGPFPAVRVAQSGALSMWRARSSEFRLPGHLGTACDIL